MRLSTVVGTGSVMILALAGCSSVTGGDAPKTVEDKASKLATDSLNAIAQVPGHSVKTAEWEKCSEETPGVHRADYTYVLLIDVDKSASQQVFDQVTTYWKKQGYVTEPQGPGNATRVVHLKDNADWTIGIGIDTGGQMFLNVDSGCAHVSSDPKAG